MRRGHRWLPAALAGGAAGLVNGLFGAGAEWYWCPLLVWLCGLSQRRAFATSVAVILPLCALSSVIYLTRGALEFGTSLPYLAGGLVGGWIGGRVFKGVNMTWLRRVFALFILYGGVRALL